MVAQGVQLVGIGERHAHFFGLGFQRAEGLEQLGRVGFADLQVALNLAQAAIPAEHPRAHAELVQRRHDARQRQHDRQQNAQHQPHALDEVGNPERQVALQHGHGLVHGTIGFLCSGQFTVARVGELARAVEPACAAVQLLGILCKQREQGRVGALAGQ